MNGVKCILLDIEGTVCPISFVKDTLFPYALKALPDVLASQWDSEDFKPYQDAFPEDARASSEALEAHVEDLTKRDVKVAYLKNLQGYLWETGYKTGAYSTPLFDDVVPKLKEWKDGRIVLAIYSSGSVFAQKLLFGHVRCLDSTVTGQKRARKDHEVNQEDDVGEPPSKRVATVEDDVKREDFKVEGFDQELSSQGKPEGKSGDTSTPKDVHSKTEDLRNLFSDWFDITNAGPKTEASSYTKIKDTLDVEPGEVLFLSDNPKECDAALAAGMRSLIVDRPGNAPLLDGDSGKFGVVKTFDHVHVDFERSGGRPASQPMEAEQ